MGLGEVSDSVIMSLATYPSSVFLNQVGARRRNDSVPLRQIRKSYDIHRRETVWLEK